MLTSFKDEPKLLVLAQLAARTGMAARRQIQELVDSRGWTLEVWSMLREVLAMGPEDREVQTIEAEIGRWVKQGIRVTPYASAEYPARLRSISDPPFLLYSRGGPLSVLETVPTAAIVGARKAHERSAAMSYDIGKVLADRTVVVVSGLAAGVDAAAHRGALQSGAAACPTVAVFGCGLNHIYPAMNRGLAQEILARGGILLSQFEPDQRPFPANFLNRNRVIAGLGDVTVVVEAGGKSGSLTTARAAAEYGREVLVLPGAWWDANSEGSNRLIQNGAHVVLSAGEVAEFMGLPETKSAPSGAAQNELDDKDALSDRERELLAAIPKGGEAHEDVLLQRFPDPEETRLALMTLELSGLIDRKVGNRYVVR